MENTPKQSFRINTDDADLGKHLQDSLMSLGHSAEVIENKSQLLLEKIYQDDVHEKIRMKPFLDQLVSNLFYSYGDPFTPQVLIVPENLEMDIDTAIPVSLIVNELVTNALKYAYEGVQPPSLTIQLTEQNAQYHLMVTYNAPKGGKNSFGLHLVRELVRQLHGTVELNTTPAGDTQWIIEIPVHQNEMS